MYEEPSRFLEYGRQRKFLEHDPLNRFLECDQLDRFHERGRPVEEFRRMGATRGVTVSTCAFLACHQCYCAGSSLAWGLNIRALVCGIF